MSLRRLTLLLLLLTSNSSFAFDAQGHIAICQLAFNLSNASTQTWLNDTLQKSPETNFAHGCIWPDDIRNERDYRDSKVWHYINIARTATRINASDCPAEGCVTNAINTMRQRLQQNPADWQALLFLGHFIADVHQPMHVSYADDRGGNRAAITYLGEPTNLHQLWDGGLLQPFNIRQSVSLWQSQLTAVQQHNWQQGDTVDWASESLQLTRDIYRRYQQSDKAGEQYRSHFLPLLEVQMQKAGVRLAWVLDQISGQINNQRTKPPKVD